MLFFFLQRVLLRTVTILCSSVVSISFLILGESLIAFFLRLFIPLMKLSFSLFTLLLLLSQKPLFCWFNFADFLPSEYLQAFKHHFICIFYDLMFLVEPYRFFQVIQRVSVVLLFFWNIVLWFDRFLLAALQLDLLRPRLLYV